MTTRAIALTLTLFVTSVNAHGNMVDPPCRGITNGYKFWRIPIYARGDRNDPTAHFPAGDKNTRPGAGKLSQERAASSKGWTLYEPTKPGFRFRSGPCGDLLSQRPGDHMKGGKYYNGGKIHKVYEQGGKISIDMVLVAHHNGFSEFRVCDAKKCGGDISNDCLRDSNKCRMLKRAFISSCESRNDMGCGPMDPNYPGRWYHPCPSNNGDDFYGNGKIVYDLPADFHCEHCILQWHWTTANGCNPPGVRNYFMGSRGPNWGGCRGQGGAIGGYRRDRVFCEGRKFAEEYYMCADIKINKDGEGSRKNSGKTHGRSSGVVNSSTDGKPNGVGGGSRSSINLGKSQVGAWSNHSETYLKSFRSEPAHNRPITISGSKRSESILEKIGIHADDSQIGFAYNGNKVVVDMNHYGQMTFSAETFGAPKGSVLFYINGSLKWEEENRPFVFLGNKGSVLSYWKNPILNKWFIFKVQAGDSSMKIEVYLKK